MADPFLVIGAMKSGTTTLHAILATHPDVEVVVEKESSALLKPDTARALADRVRSSTRVVAGEVTAAYMQQPLVPSPAGEAIQLLGPNVKVIAILRDPFHRALSHWRHLTQLGREDQGAAQALLDPSRPYLAFSRYWSQLLPWQRNVSTDQMLVMSLEEYRVEPARVLAGLWDFLGVATRADDGRLVHVNAGDDRVVATGWRRSVSGSRVYRGFVRPLIPAAVRRRAAAVAGGGKGRVQAPPTVPGLRSAFFGEISSDLARLAVDWPAMRWTP